MTNEEIIEIRTRCEAATPGPWTQKMYSYFTPGVDRDDEIIISLVDDTIDNFTAASTRLIANTDFIAHAREDIPKLLDALNEAKALIDILALGAAEHSCPANGHITCDTYINAGNVCIEASQTEYRKKCWLEAAERLLDVEKEFDEARFTDKIEIES